MSSSSDSGDSSHSSQIYNDSSSDSSYLGSQSHRRTPSLNSSGSISTVSDFSTNSYEPPNYSSPRSPSEFSPLSTPSLESLAATPSPPASPNHSNNSSRSSSDFNNEQSGDTHSLPSEHSEDIADPESSSDDDSIESNRMPRLRSSGNQSNSITSLGSSQGHSDDTEEYNFEDALPNLNNSEEAAVDDPVIEINDTQAIEENDDVVLIPQVIETIDLCTQAFPIPRAFRLSEVIEVIDSPTQVFQAVASDVTRRDTSGPSRNLNRNRTARENTAPYQKKNLFLDDSDDGLTQSIKVHCPICLESVVDRNPVSTNCGHVFCRKCLEAALKQLKKCPMCKKGLTGKNAFHNIFLGV